MKIFAFIKLLNKKINKYDNLASNPFGDPQPITLIWIDDDDKSYYKNEKSGL